MHCHMRDSDMTASDVAVLEESMVVRTYRRDDKIFSQGSKATGLFCVRGGYALLWHLDDFKYKTAFRVVGAGELMGYRSLFGEDLHTATAQALTACDACYYPKDVVLQLIDEFPSFTRRFLRALARDRGPRDALVLRSQHIPVRIRLCNLLLMMIKDENCEKGGTCILKLPILRRDMAALLATRPESITRAIKELRDDGIVVFKGRTVSVPNLDALYTESNHEQPPPENEANLSG
jgi:CRP/FNR family transcriptional regulator